MAQAPAETRKQELGQQDPGKQEPGRQKSGRRELGRHKSGQQDLGRRGEDLACRYLEEQGLAVLSRNWTCRDGELDVVAVEDGRLVVCEVKTRSGPVWGRPDEAVDADKLSRLRRTALRWLAAHGVGWCNVRVDLISVTWPPDGEARLQHLRGA